MGMHSVYPPEALNADLTRLFRHVVSLDTAKGQDPDTWELRLPPFVGQSFGRIKLDSAEFVL